MGGGKTPPPILYVLFSDCLVALRCTLDIGQGQTSSRCVGSKRPDVRTAYVIGQ